MSNLTNAVTVVTGASSGIGAATAKRLGASGAKVVLAARNEDKLRALVSEITEAGGTATYRVTDVIDRADAKALAAFSVETYGPVDVLVNNAGLMLFSAWKDTAVDDWDRMIDTNLRGYLHAIAAVLPSMLERRSGRILNMSSVAGITSARAQASTARPSSSSGRLPRACARRSASRTASVCRWSVPA